MVVVWVVEPCGHFINVLEDHKLTASILIAEDHITSDPKRRNLLSGLIRMESPYKRSVKRLFKQSIWHTIFISILHNFMPNIRNNNAVRLVSHLNIHYWTTQSVQALVPHLTLHT